MLQQNAVRILPIALNQERVTSVCRENGSNFFERLNAAFNPAWIDEQRQTCHLRVPKLLVNFEKGKLYWLVRVINEFEVIVDVSAAHGAAEMNIELEQVCRENVGGRINLSDDRG